MIIDTKFGDVNGDMIPDNVYLIGDNNAGGQFYKNISIIVEDGRTKFRYQIPLQPSYSSAGPWLFVGSFINNRVQEIFVCLPLNDRSVYYILSFQNNQPEFILAPEQFPQNYQMLSSELPFDINYKDFYKVEVTSSTMMGELSIDISYRKQLYEDDIYDKNGTLIKPFKGFVMYSPELYPVPLRGNRPLRLMAIDDIAGVCGADRLGQVVYYFTYYSPLHTWTLDHHPIQVMISDGDRTFFKCHGG